MNKNKLYNKEKFYNNFKRYEICSPCGRTDESIYNGYIYTKNILYTYFISDSGCTFVPIVIWHNMGRH